MATGTCTMLSLNNDNAPDGFIIEHGYHDLFQFDNDDLIIDDRDHETTFFQEHNNFTDEDVSFLDKQLDALQLNDLDFMKNQVNVINSSSSSAFDCFKSRLATRFGKLLNAKLLDRICLIFEKKCNTFSEEDKKKIEELIFDMLKLFDGDRLNSQVSDDDNTSILSIMEFLDEDESTQDLEQDDVNAEFISEFSDHFFQFSSCLSDNEENSQSPHSRSTYEICRGEDRILQDMDFITQN
ncbi:hypothetical protein ACP70R_033219 [Stipagrostis hirtigluma subsp. patula]